MEILETEHGAFTNNEETGQTAHEVYEEWLNDNFDFVDGEYVRKQIDICTTETDAEKIKKLENTVHELTDMVIMMSRQ